MKRRSKIIEEATANAIWVLPDGVTEVRFARRLKPHLFREEAYEVADGEPPHFVVEPREDGYEYTSTRNGGGGHFIPIVPIPPRGVGWEMFDSSSDKRTVWRRRATK
ncbi:hypothetical protein [Bradyrhizobium sp. th.b2]|uniref:hypothetical protein n=1 Tax=Bradyrhizobium sp. th-b2 TaxID=172088 RepID=UPI0012EC56CB|nr:hypothetical protein [Bradyrhizobium sp. th.b2]